MNTSFHLARTFLLSAAIGAVGAASAASQSLDDDIETPVVLVIPIEGPIENALVYIIRRGVAEAQDKDVAAIVFDMDTPGGGLKEAREIVNLIENLKMPTYTFVRQEAFSAGAIIALATKHIYMAPGSVIGDAMPIMSSPFSGPQDMPENLQEKMVSAVSALIRSAAEQGGHDKQLAEAMVRREIEYKIGEEVIAKEGQLLTLTNLEAEQKVGEDDKPLLSEGTLEDIPALLARIDLGNAEVRTLEITGSERMARHIKSLSILFLGAGILGLYVEMKTPGLGLPGVLGALSLAVFFLGHHVAGLAGVEELALIALGIALLGVEVFVIPGFGVAGIAGLSFILLGLLLSMVQHYPGGPRIPAWPAFRMPVGNLSLSVIFATGGALLFARFLPRTRMLAPLRLDAEASVADGYAASSDTAGLLRNTGETVTPLRPSGSARFGDDKLDVVTDGRFVEARRGVRIVETHGSRIVVEPLPDGD